MNELEYNNSDMAKPTFIEVGEVDKIREELENYVANGCSQEALDFSRDAGYNWIAPTKAQSFYMGYKSRDEEIKKLRETLINIQLLTRIEPSLPAILLTTIYNIAEEALKDII